MNREEFDGLRDYISRTAGMNQRYHQQRASYWTWWNRAVQIAVAVLAALGACFAVAAMPEHHGRWIDFLALGASTLAAVAAITLNVVPLCDWSQQHRDFLRRWADVREDIDGLQFHDNREPSTDEVDRLKGLASKVHRICADEPAPDEELLKKCHDAEVRSRRTAEENASAVAAVAAAS